MGLTAATLKEQFRYLRSRIPSYLVKQFQDHKKIINSESSNSHHVCLSTHLGNITCV